MHIVFSKTDLAVVLVINMAIVLKNTQKVDDLITLTSEISVSMVRPGINISTQITRQLITMSVINAILRHLYLSVRAPTTGLTIKAGSGINVKIKPTMTDE